MPVYYLRMMAFFAVLIMLLLLWWSWQAYHRKKLKEKIAAMPFPESYRNVLQKIPHYQRLSEEDKHRIERSILYFIHTKTFVGVKMEVTEEMKAVIAFYACLLLLHLPQKGCYDALRTIILYPSTVIYDAVRENGGIYTKEKFLIDGQSAGDTVVLVWHDAKFEAYHLRHENVIVHEFAHEIDFMDGMADGVPPMERSKYHEWTSVLFKDYQKLHDVALKNREWGRYKLLGEYAATNEAEFFAVVTERFFESPHSLKRHFPELYEELKDFYRIDPVALVEK